MTLQMAKKGLYLQLTNLYDEREADNIADWVMEYITGMKKIDRLMIYQQPLSNNQLNLLKRLTYDLINHRPIQYVLGEAWFAGMKFYVNESVLIPRPETEELVDWVACTIKHSKSKIQKLLDIGTGSGCIPISLKKKLPQLSVTSIDISEAALKVAKQNADSLGISIDLVTINFLDENSWNVLPIFDLIISNPPYIKQTEEKNMSRNVLDFEPSLALFVPDEDALIFYKKIFLFSKTHLAKNGYIFLEINETLGNEVVQLFESNEFLVELKKDLQEKDRMLKISFS